MMLRAPLPTSDCRRGLALLTALLLLLGGCSRPQARLYRWEALQASARPLIVVDLDDTVVSGSGWARSVLVPFSSSVCAYPDAARTLTRLSRTHDLVFLTARPALVSRTSLGWLDASGFPRAPVFFSSPFAAGRGAQTHYKTCALRWLSSQGRDVAWGIGDKQSDMDAYDAVGAASILILASEGDPDAQPQRGSKVVVGHATAWRQIDQLLQASPAPTRAALPSDRPLR